MGKILVSKCLLGVACKYDGTHNRNEKVLSFLKGKEYVSFCPEVAGGLKIPRQPSEILAGTDQVISKTGEDVTEFFEKGAKLTLKFAIQQGVSMAILKSASPSCGAGEVYDGTFTHTKINGNGITAQLLLDNGISVLTEKDL